MGASKPAPVPATMAFASSVQRGLSTRVCMTAGQADGSEGNTSPIRPPKPSSPTSSHKIENRPELVGGLPLWLTVGVAGHVRHFMESWNFAPFAALRRRQVAFLENHLVKNRTYAPDTDLPVGRVLRKIADTMEEEMASLRLSLATMRTELMQAQRDLTIATKELQFLKLRNAKRRSSEEELAATAVQLRFLLCKEQTRATAAEKQLLNMKTRLIAAEKKNSHLAGDIVKVSVMYSSFMVVLIAFIAESPFGPSILHHLMTGGN